jgi:hypothetical protein
MDRGMRDEDIQRELLDELAHGRAVLLTGAGFSVEARDRDGRPIPSGDELADELWSLCFPDEPRDDSELEDLFQHALAESPDALEELVRRRLCVDPARLPALYRDWFSLPWRRIYTLNVDDLESAVATRHEDLPRRIEVRSALGDGPRPALSPAEGALEVVHLNGHVADAPRGMTFSTTQYGARLAADEDLAYKALVADFRSLPFVLVGTRLDESPLWRELQRAERRDGEEPRRPPCCSFLVTPAIERARRSLLERIGVVWVPMSTREFTERVISPLARKLGEAGTRVMARAG